MKKTQGGRNKKESQFSDIFSFVERRIRSIMVMKIEGRRRRRRR